MKSVFSFCIDNIICHDDITAPLTEVCTLLQEEKWYRKYSVYTLSRVDNLKQSIMPIWLHRLGFHRGVFFFCFLFFSTVSGQGAHKTSRSPDKSLSSQLVLSGGCYGRGNHGVVCCCHHFSSF